MPLSKIKKAQKYQIKLYRSINTPDIFFELILKSIFHLDVINIEIIIKNINENGYCLLGIYTKEIANTKKFLVEKNAKFNKYFIKCEIEPFN